MTLRDERPLFHQVSLVGEIDLTNARAHGDLLCRVLDLGAGATLLVDCGQIAFLELSGMAMMQRVHRHGIMHGTTVRWVGFSPAHRRLLELAGLDRRLHLDERAAPRQDDQASAARSSASQKRKKPSWSSPIWWK